MFQRTYQVKGEDVNEVMLMQNFAYIKYASKILETFWLSNGYSNIKLQQLNVLWQKDNEQLFKFKNLFFTNFFKVKLELTESENMNENNQVVKIAFFNDQNEKCAQINASIVWYDLFSLQQISIPKRLEKYLNTSQYYSSEALAVS